VQLSIREKRRKTGGNDEYCQVPIEQHDFQKK
jgi:hypothetical protein